MGDLLDESFDIHSIENMCEKYRININFPEYHSLRLQINDFKEFQEKTLNAGTLPRNTPIPDESSLKI